MPESFACIGEIIIRLDRFLFASVVYPTDSGFVPETLSLDGDPPDVMVCVSRGHH